MPDAIVSTQIVEQVTPYNPAMVQVFKSQLETYRDQLISLYQQRAKLVADRELARFKYLVSWRFRFESALSWLFQHVPQNLMNLETLFASGLKANIPMTDMSGKVASGYRAYAPYINAPGLSVNYFMPVAAFFETVYHQPGVAVDTFWRMIKNTGNIASYLTLQKSEWVIGPNGSGTVFSVHDNALNVNRMFTVPPSIDFIRAQFGIDDAQAQGMSALYSQDTGMGSFNQIMTDGYSDFKSLLDATSALFAFQPKIDLVEEQIAAFLAQYKAYGLIDQALSLSDVLKELQALADLQNAQAAMKAATAPPVPVEVPKKTNWVPYAVGLVAIAALMRRKKGNA